MKKVRFLLVLFGAFSLAVWLGLIASEWEGCLPWVYGGVGLVLLSIYGILEWRHRQRAYQRHDFPGSATRRGAALILVLATLALIATLLAIGGARVYTLRAAQGRADRQARLRAAIWDAAWTRLRLAAAAPDGAPIPAQRESPDGVKTSVAVQRIGAESRGEPARFALSVQAEYAGATREAWSLVQRNTSGDFRVLTWVER